MDGHTTGSAGLVTNDRRSSADHPAGYRLGVLDRATDKITAACIILNQCSRQEVQAARELLHFAAAELLDLLQEETRSAREGQRCGQGVHGEDPKDAQVSRITLDPANDDIYDPKN